MLKIIPIPALKDNYIWCGVNDKLGQAFVVDPGDASPVFDFLNKHRLILTGIWVTHKHADHTGGISELLNTYPDTAVYAPQIENIPLTTRYVQQDEAVVMDKWQEPFKVIHIPGHTLGHVAYYANPILFSGDTLFGAGCGHEYTLANLRFALHVEPKNEDIQHRIKLTEKIRSDNIPSLPSTMGLEKKTNPFLRCMQKNIISKVEGYANRKLTNTVAVFHELREWKNRF